VDLRLEKLDLRDFRLILKKLETFVRSSTKVLVELVSDLNPPCREPLF